LIVRYRSMPATSRFDRVPRFIVSGGSATVCHWLLMWLLTLGGTAPASATAWGAVAGAGVNYLLQRNWTFRDKAAHRAVLPRFLTTAAIAWMANLCMFAALHQGCGLRPAFAQALTTLGVAVLTYFLYARLVFDETTA
jgi:putative flippase GtrA